MALHNDLGKAGEKIAAEYLQREGYQILERNWRYRRAEIDLIVKKEDVLIFVEVKTRSSGWFDDPEMAVDQTKENLITDAAGVYLEQINHQWEIRFDIIAIVCPDENSFDIRHYEDAFFPGMQG